VSEPQSRSAGHHCAQLTLRRYGLEAAVRPSLAMYNTCAEVDTLAAALSTCICRADCFGCPAALAMATRTLVQCSI